MPFQNSNWDDLNGAINHKDDNYETLSKEEIKKMSFSERLERYKRNHMAREGYRNFTGKQYSLLYMVVTDILSTLFGIFVVAFCAVCIALGVYGLIGSNILFGTLVVLWLSLFVLWCVFRPFFKRRAFVGKLKRVCKKNKFRVRFYTNPLRSARGFTNHLDFTVDTGKYIYDVMFMAPSRKYTRLRFEKPDEVKIVTGYTKSRIKLILGLKERVRVKKYGFESSPNAKKVILLNPAPREMYYYDKRDDRVVMGGSGADFFGYYAFTGTAFINHILRETEK